MQKKESFYTKDVVLVMMASFFFMFSTMFINPLINGYAKELGSTAVFAGLIVGIMSLASMFLRPVAGNLTDHFSKYLLATIGGVLIFLGILGYILTPNSELLLVFRLLNGTGFVLATVCMTTWLALLVPRQHVGEAMGFYGLMNALAMAVAPAVSINLYHLIGYRKSIMFAAAAALLMIICVQFVGDHGQPVQLHHPRPHAAFQIIQPNVLPVAILTTLFAIPYFTTQADIVSYVEQRNVNVAVGTYFLIYAVILLAIRIIFKAAFDTVRFGVWFWVSWVATGLYVTFLAVMTNNWLMFLAAAGMAVGYGVIYSVLQATAMLLAPMDEQGLASATFYLGLDIGMTLGPILGGVIDTIFPIHDFYLVQLALLPLMLIVYLIWRKRLNGAIDHH
ncbi:MFS transporter [uncultured Limosilactobacillus sp.]|uniref:MFS transporter n=1 Tax=uncultured Limosilactobacillus sp. TaxID=2837629 RepID=UPI0025FC3D44|nr:MFS transporter [uncultured Limosilactobacillus sp.]